METNVFGQFALDNASESKEEEVMQICGGNEDGWNGLDESDSDLDQHLDTSKPFQTYVKCWKSKIDC